MILREIRKARNLEIENKSRTLDKIWVTPIPDKIEEGEITIFATKIFSLFSNFLN